MSTPAQPRQQQILEEIERLTRELQSRQAEPRPVPSSVLRAYHTVLTRHYEQLEDDNSGARSINIP